MTLTWRESLERVCAAVVSVRIDAPRPFDTEWNGSSQATAFVVDAEQGLLLSNRHVVQPIRPPALRLRPDKALVGTELRVVGNDAGEKLSILAGTLARVDRPAPLYGSSKYNDFNTFYLQAASGATGGSSGSPVVDIEGDVIALNAGSRTQAASSFFLPLERVLRAFELLRAGQPIPRGTLMTTFSYTPFDELARLGLRPETEQACRAADPGGIGLLIVDKLIPGGVTDGLLEPGDILLRVDGEFIPRFVPLEAHLDASVGQTITLELERGGRPLTVRARVHDLHAISPSTYLEIGGAILHDLSYQRARNPQVPLTGVYLANSGYLFSPLDLDRGAVIRAIAGVPTPDLAAAEAVLGSLPHAAPFMVRWIDLDQPTREHVTVATMDRRWFAMTRSSRDDASGRWPSADAPRRRLLRRARPSPPTCPRPTTSACSRSSPRWSPSPATSPTRSTASTRPASSAPAWSSTPGAASCSSTATPSRSPSPTSPSPSPARSRSRARSPSSTRTTTTRSSRTTRPCSATRRSAPSTSRRVRCTPAIPCGSSGSSPATACSPRARRSPRSRPSTCRCRARRGSAP
ncbi:trypsin-like peptidase domain-containing protein [Nannocystis pusilla]|uniref:Trypsin-like peptidase domain-containing protein n=1 Tax=Nannocystis pusilla TaxID=889268 RepID=A0A9X3EPQ5_9BACT|nr:trypsin-like peptidase domain-containing protein [Nannocystis pusilla]MCY1007561.1 trypsin-like peptidase domain-containing protein [Nannocystis pusilla]